MPRINPYQKSRRPAYEACIRPPEKKKAPSTAAGGVPILTENKEKDGYELKFPGKPTEAVLAMFRETKTLPVECRWHWHFKKKVWYAKRNDATREFAQLVISQSSGLVIPEVAATKIKAPALPMEAASVSPQMPAPEPVVSSPKFAGGGDPVPLNVEHEQFPKHEWALDVQRGDTRLSYEDWVEAKMDQAAEEAVEPTEAAAPFIAELAHEQGIPLEEVPVVPAGPRSWKTEVCVDHSWSSNSCRYATKAEAETAGKELLSRWMSPTDSRAAESDDAVNYRFNSETYKSEPIITVMDLANELAKEIAPKRVVVAAPVPENVILASFTPKQDVKEKPVAIKTVPVQAVPDWRNRFSWSRR